MKKYFIASFIVLFLAFSLSSCFWDSKNSDVKDLSYYKNLWKDAFRNYQTSVAKIPKKGKFDFEMTSMATGSGEALSRLGNMEFSEKFSSLSVALLGDYDFESVDHPSIDATLKIYFNKRSFGAGDIDITFNIDGSGSVSYSLNHLDRLTLVFLGAPKDMIDSLMLSYEEDKGKTLHSDAQAQFLQEVIATFQEKQKNSPLRENSKEEEKKIIDAFLDTQTIEVTAGAEKDDSISELSFRFNPDNCIKFLNQVAVILGGPEAQKQFDGNKEILSSFTIQGTMDISSEKRITDSHILAEIPLSSIDIQTGMKKYDFLELENKFLYPNPERFDIDLTTLIFSKNTPDNKLQFHFRGLIK